MRFQIALLVGMLVVSGCGSTGGRGSVLGVSPSALASGVIGRGNGKATEAIMAALDGGLVGGQIGAGLGAGERKTALEAEYRALEYTPSGQAVTWGDPGSGRYGEVVAASPYRVGSQDCRQYMQTVHVNGRSQRARGTACRNPNGSWALLS
jgi:surface antigen